MSKGYKFLTSEMKSKSGNCKWTIGEWKKHDGELEMCESGFHYCKEPIEAFEYVYGDMFCVVEVKGKEKTEGNKTVAEEMRVVKVLDTKRVAVQFAIACARRSLPNYEKEYPKDDRPRKAIEAAETWFANPTKENESAARSAWSAARSAESAAWSARWSAARSAAWSAARSAAESAESAARSAARSAAQSAAWSAESAAWSAAWSAESAAESAAWSAAWSAEKKWQNKILLSIIEET